MGVNVAAGVAAVEKVKGLKQQLADAKVEVARREERLASAKRELEHARARLKEAMGGEDIGRVDQVIAERRAKVAALESEGTQKVAELHGILRGGQVQKVQSVVEGEVV